MLTRTRREEVVFGHPFLLKGWAEPRPAGTYVVETEEELLEGLSFPAYRRTSTTLSPKSRRAGALVQAIPVDPRDLEAAQAADRARRGAG